MIGLLAAAILILSMLPEIFEENKGYKTVRKILLTIGTVATLGLVFIPSEQGIYIMMAAKTITRIRIRSKKYVNA